MYQHLYRLAFLLIFFAIGAAHAFSQGTKKDMVTLIRVPDNGIQPQAVVDKRGLLHLVYFKGDPAHGDLYYVHKNLISDTGFSAPVRVNSHQNSAIALGTIRGAQIVTGSNGQIYVTWNGSDQAAKGKDGTTPMLFTRSTNNGATFEPERNLISGTEVIDGGGAVAADPKNGMVYVFWHAVSKGGDEAGGGIFMARSANGGMTFSPVQRLRIPPMGTCGCCGMRASIDSTGALYVLYRIAAKNTERDTMLLTSLDKGATFKQSEIQQWPANTCPMSLFGLVPALNGSGAVGVWETKEQVYMSTLSSKGEVVGHRLPVAQSLSGNQKYPVIAISGNGTKLVAWAEGVGWQRGGALVWQVVGLHDIAIAEQGRIPDGVPTWSLPAAATRPDGTYVIIH